MRVWPGRLAVTLTSQAMFTKPRFITASLKSLVGLTLLVGATACDDDSSGPGARTVTMSFTSGSTAAASTASVDVASSLKYNVVQSAEGLVVTSGDDELVITSAQIVFRNVKLQPGQEGCVDDSEDSETEEEDDNCATMFVGPILVDIPTDALPGSEISVLIPEGSYRSVQLRLHKISSNSSADAAFRAEHPDFGDASVKVEGTFNGVPFTYLSDITATVNLPLPAPIVVGGEDQDLTVELDVGSWFLSQSGSLLSPLDDNNQARQAIRSNIRTAIRAFRDNNQDGQED